MTFISYAQNYEDVMLWRALRSVEAGFWIDVGAAHPSEYSVTRAFYDRGWHGVNIEPEPDYAAVLRAERPRDINLQMAIGAEPARTTFHRIRGTGLSTFDSAVAADHAAAGFPAAQPIEVEVTTLAAVFAAHAGQDVHFLKVDVEGAEREVLRGADLKTNRPWIILAEATVPGTPEMRIDDFADLLVAADYRQCWFDGLNAFFLAAEHDAGLSPCFRTPPNVFDDFLRADHMAALVGRDAAEHRVAELERSQTEAQATLATSIASHEAKVSALEAEVARLGAVERRLAEVDRALHEAWASRDDVVARHNAAVAEHGAAMAEKGAQIQRLEAEVCRLEAEVGRLEAALGQSDAELNAMRQSLTWRLSKPLRSAVRVLRSAR
jgi:FkbM family methyltransferase